MPRTQNGQYELVLENRQVLGIFFVAAVLCGVFFALGYIVGKNTGSPSPPQASQAAPPATSEGKRSPLEVPPAPPAKPESEAKPAGLGTAPQAEGESASKTQPPGQSSELTSSKPMEGAGTPAGGSANAAAAPAAKGAGQGTKAESRPASGATAAVAGAITLQVAALSKAEDAQAMVDLLKSKNFSASILSLAGDRLFHVQVGPFASLQEAEGAKARLEKEGFKPIIKKN